MRMKHNEFFAIMMLLGTIAFVVIMQRIAPKSPFTIAMIYTLSHPFGR